MKFQEHLIFLEANSEDPIVKSVLNLMGTPKGLFWLKQKLKIKSPKLENGRVKNPTPFYVEFDVMTQIADILQAMPKNKVKELYELSKRGIK